MKKYIDLSRVIDVEPSLSELFLEIDDDDLAEEAANRMNDYFAELLVDYLDEEGLQILITKLHDKTGCNI